MGRRGPEPSVRSPIAAHGQSGVACRSRPDRIGVEWRPYAGYRRNRQATHADHAGSTSGKPACGPAERHILPEAGQAHLYPESEWQAAPAGYSDTDRPHRPARHADGYGPEWESDFHRLSYGFRPERSVHHAVRTVKLQLQDGSDTRGRWVIEGDLASYFDTVHHRLLLRSIRRRIIDDRFIDLLWRILKAGHIERGLFVAASEGVPQGGVLSPLLSNIMLHEFDTWLETKYLSHKARKDRWAWNFGIQQQRPITVRENRQWKPAVAYCRYADDFVVIVKGTKAHAETIREECRDFLENRLKLKMNMEKSHITHVDDGFVLFFWEIGSFGNGDHAGVCPWSRQYPRRKPRPLFTD